MNSKSYRKEMTKVLKLMANMLVTATFALFITSCEENENTATEVAEIISILNLKHD
jgi:hypothetical protein